MPILHTIASNPHPSRQKIAFSRSRFQPWRLRDNTSCTRRSAVSTPTPMTPAKRLTIAFEPSAGSLSRRSRRVCSIRLICSRTTRTTPGTARRSFNGGSKNSSSKPVIRLAAAASKRALPPPTATSQCATASARRSAMPRMNTAASSRPGNSNRRRGARAPQMRCDDHRLRDRAGTSTLLFATQSPSRHSVT